MPNCWIALTVVAALTGPMLGATLTPPPVTRVSYVSAAASWSPLVRLESQNRALFAIVDTDKQQFSVAECVGLAPGTMAPAGSCALLVDAWQPTGAVYQAAFERAFNDDVALQNEKLRESWRFRGSVGNLAISGFVGAGAGAFSLFTLVMRTFNAVPVIPIGVAASAITFTALEYKDHERRASRSIETDLVRFDRQANGRVTISPKDLQTGSELVYAAIKSSLVTAMATRPIL